MWRCAVMGGRVAVRYLLAQWLLMFFAGVACRLGEVGLKAGLRAVVGAFHGRADFQAGRSLDHVGPDIEAMAGVGRIAAGAATSGAAAFLLVLLGIARPRVIWLRSKVGGRRRRGRDRIGAIC